MKDATFNSDRKQINSIPNNFLLIDATDRSNMSSNQKRLFFAASLHIYIPPFIFREHSLQM